MKKILMIVLIVALVLSATACGDNASTDGASGSAQTTVAQGDVLATVNGQVVDKALFDKAFTMLELSYRQQYGEDVMSRDVNGKTLGDALKVELLDSLVTELILHDHLTKENFAIDAKTLDEAFAKYEQAIADKGELRAQLSDAGIDDAFIKQRLEMQSYVMEFYNRVRDDITAQIDLSDPKWADQVVKVDAQHILVKTSEEADQVVARLAAGESFEALAEELSQDPGSAANGGNLGEFGRGEMVKPFEEAAFATAVGAVSAPVESEFGFHIIKVNQALTVEDIKAREDGAAQLIDIKEKLVNSQFQTGFDGALAELRSQYEIEIFPENISVTPVETTPVSETTTK